MNVSTDIQKRESIRWITEAWDLYKANLRPCFAIGFVMFALVGMLILGAWIDLSEEGFPKFFSESSQSGNNDDLDTFTYCYLSLILFFSLLNFSLGSKIVQKGKIRFWDIWPGLSKFIAIFMLWCCQTLVLLVDISIIEAISDRVCSNTHDPRYPLVMLITYLVMIVVASFVSFNYLLGYVRIASGERFFSVFRRCLHLAEPRQAWRLISFSFFLSLISCSVLGVFFAAPFGAILVGLAARGSGDAHAGDANSDLDPAQIPGAWPPAPSPSPPSSETPSEDDPSTARQE
jgi:hypothetical protein